MARPIILIHGFRGTREGLQLIADNVKGRECFIPDLPGFGDGPVLDSYTLDDYVEWLATYVKELNLKETPILLGHSFGSIVAAAYAAQYPKTIKKLVLVNPIGAPALEGPRGFLSRLAVFYYWIGKKIPSSIGKLWLSSWPSVQVMSSIMAKTKDKSTRAFIHSQHHTHFSRFHSADSVYQGFKTSVSHDVSQVATAIKTPTLLIAGALDDITPLAKQKELVKLFPDARLVVVDRVGHLTHYETPDQIASAVSDFIKDE